MTQVTIEKVSNGYVLHTEDRKILFLTMKLMLLFLSEYGWHDPKED